MTFECLNHSLTLPPKKTIWKWFEMRFRLDALAAQIGFQIVFCDMLHNIYTIHTSLHCRVFSFATEQQFANSDFKDAYLEKEIEWKPHLKRGYVCVINRATHADKLVTSGHTNLIRSLAINSADSLFEKIWGKNKFWFDCSLNIVYVKGFSSNHWWQ